MRYIALLDILGFGQFVESHSLEEITNAYAPMLTSVHFSKKMSEKEGPILDYQVHSDTICVIAPDDSLESFYTLLMTCHIQIQAYFYLLRENGSERFPLRGAIAKSDILWDDYQFTTQAYGRDPIKTKSIPTLLGKGIVQADRWEKCQEWSGVSICPNLYHELCNQGKMQPFLDSHLLIEYDVPIKNDGKKKTAAINPIEACTIDLVLPVLKTLREAGKLHSKIENTAKFIDYIVENDLCFPRGAYKKPANL